MSLPAPAPKKPESDPTLSSGYESQKPALVKINLPAQHSWVTYVILGSTIIVYLLQLLSQVVFNGADIPAALGMKVNEAIVLGQFWRLITPMLLHGSLLHIGFNMYALHIFGRGLERHYGHWRFLALYLMGAFVGNVFSFLLSISPSLGASTAIFGLVGAEGVFIFSNRKWFGQRARPMLLNIAMIVGINLMLGLSPGIDNWGHMGGLIGGAIFAWFAGPLWQVDGVYPDLSLNDVRFSGSRTVIVAVVEAVIFFSLVIISMVL